MAQFGEILQELRQSRNLTQAQLAKAIHASNNTISAYERGTRLPILDNLVALADYFDVTTDYLAGRTRHNVSIIALTEPYTEDLSIEDLLSMLKTLSPSQRQTLVALLKDLEFVARISHNR